MRPVAERGSTLIGAAAIEEKPSLANEGVANALIAGTCGAGGYDAGATGEMEWDRIHEPASANGVPISAA